MSLFWFILRVVRNFNRTPGALGKTHIKKVFFFSGRTTKDLTPPNGLVVHATFFLLVVRPLEKPLFFMCVFPYSKPIDFSTNPVTFHQSQWLYSKPNDFTSPVTLL